MKIEYGVANTDRVNKQRTVASAHVLAESIEAHVRQCVSRGLPIGMPFNISHDLKRPIGWTVSNRLHMGPDMARQLVEIHRPDTDEERTNLESLLTSYWTLYHREATQPHAAGLEERLAPADLTGATAVKAEVAAFKRPGLAAELYPEFFEAQSEAVDKDGLVDFATLLSRTREIMPGVFHEPVRNLALFAHRYFRRSYSHANTLNWNALESFTRIAREQTEGVARLRLDPDLVGAPETPRHVLELEYWHGPRFNDDLSAIPNGVSTHKATERQRFFSGVDKTQIWWKAPETRTTDGGVAETYRTFEIEELVEDAAAGLEGATFGCRYAHAEYNAASGAISHFDGAIRAYAGEAYLERIEVAIDRAGKQAEYTKLFRLDGAVPVASWKRLLTDWYRGNDLVPEYLGGEQEDDDAVPSPDALTNGPPVLERPGLSALLRVAKGVDLPKTGFVPETMALPGGAVAPFLEVGRGKTADLLHDHMASAASSGSYDDDILNLSLIVLGADRAIDAEWAALAADLSEALEADAVAGLVARGSVAFAWTLEGLTYTLSMEGRSLPLAGLLAEAGRIVRPSRPAANWIEPLNDALRTHAPRLEGPSDWLAAEPFGGRLRTPRSGTIEVTILMSDGLRDTLGNLPAASQSAADGSGPSTPS